MTMNDSNQDPKDDLSDVFALARQETAALSPRLARRIVADAGRVQDGFSEIQQTPADASGIFLWFRDLMGGWVGMGGLVAACATGIWLGFSPPSALPDAFVLAGLTQSDLDMFDADNLVGAWAAQDVENTSWVSE